MRRRDFISTNLAFAGGTFLLKNPYAVAGQDNENLYTLFRDPGTEYHPFVRWWWNGNMLDKDEITRELQLLKKAGIGGVEINPIEFPSRIEGDDLGIEALTWLSDEWIDMLMHAFNEAKKLELSCDLIVGSGWPFGAETLAFDERAEVVILYAEHIEGPRKYEVLRSEIFKQADPGVTVKCEDRSFDILSLKLAKEPMSGLDAVTDISEQANNEIIRVNIPEGTHVFYALVNIKSFASVINGAPGAAGPILNHMDKNAVRKYLDHMSETIERKTGPLSNHLRAFFADSMELEGCNWTSDYPEEFKKRRGYEIMPWLPFILFKVGRLGGVIDENYGAEKTEAFKEEVNRVRFDFELTKAELLYERFTLTYLQWCKDKGVKSRAQAYGRGFFPLETSLGYDLPEGESWTTNWLKHKVGEEMPDSDYRRGRAYTMINKYVSSAAHLSGNRLVSCEEMTNTYLVFNTSLERLKTGSDMSIISGVTHSVWHGFNYSPPEAPYPGWIQYGSYYNENNTWWPWFGLLNKYKARISALLQNADMYTEIAIIPANYDLWAEKGVQTDPFPEKLNVPYTSLLWEAIHKNGGGADYITEIIISRSEIRNGKICYGQKEYSTVFLPGVSSIGTSTLKKLNELVSQGGRVFTIERVPFKSLGYKDYISRDQEIRSMVDKLKTFKDNFILLERPDKDRFLEWYTDMQKKYGLPHYLDIGKPDRFFMQNRYQADDGSEILFFANSHLNRPFITELVISEQITLRRNAWIWDPESGERYRVYPENKTISLRLGPSESRIIVFDRKRKGKKWIDTPAKGIRPMEISGEWELEFIHCRGKSYESVRLDTLKDIKDIPGCLSFSGTIIYKNQFRSDGQIPEYMNLGKVHGLTELYINGEKCGTRWYGERIFKVGGLLKEGINDIEIHVVTELLNYMKSLIDNPNAQYWTNSKRKNQPNASMGILGPVIVYGWD